MESCIIKSKLEKFRWWMDEWLFHFVKCIVMFLKFCAMTEFPHQKNPTSPYISRGLLAPELVKPGRAVAPQIRCSVWNKKGPLVVDLPGGSDGKESVCNMGDLGSIPG